MCIISETMAPHNRHSLERLVEADGGGTVEDDVDAAGELLHVLWADGQAGLHQLAADGDDLLVEVGVVLPHSVEKLQTHNILMRLQAKSRRHSRERDGGSNIKSDSSVDSCALKQHGEGKKKKSLVC